MDQNSIAGARARRGAYKPKRKRGREDASQPPGLQAAKPLRSGRNLTPSRAVAAPGEERAVVHTADHPSVSGADLARAVASPLTSALRVAVRTEQETNLGGKTVDWGAFADELRDSVAKLRKGDLTHVEDMLMHQATALQAIFTRLAERALGSNQIPTVDLFFRYGLRAQAQCRATLETLAMVKNPPVLFAKQANVTSGPQQINNGLAPSRAGGNAFAPNKLSGDSRELRQDTRTPALAGPTNPPMAPVGTIDRTTNRVRKGEVVA